MMVSFINVIPLISRKERIFSFLLIYFRRYSRLFIFFVTEIRLETMVLCAAELPLAAIRSQIAGALDLMIHLGRLRDHSRHVLSITEVGDCINGEIQLNELFSFQEQKASGRRGRVEGSLVRTGELKNKAKLLAAGIDL